MFASFLLPFAERGAGPIHHWVMLAQMASFGPDEIVFIADETYFVEEAVPFGKTLKLGGLRFTCPTREEFRAFRKIPLDGSLVTGLHAIGNHLDLLGRLLVEPMPGLVSAIKDALAEYVEAGKLEAVLTWCNCPSLRRAVDELGGVAVVHNELGALRSPLYRDTFYFDMQGVNGATTAASWNPADIAVELARSDLLTDDELRGLLVADIQRVDSLQPVADNFSAGVALQVEDDSNMIAFARDWTSLAVLYEAMGRFGPESTLVRSHPGARFKYQGGLGVADASTDSLDFLNRIGTLISINSSLLAEAALWGKPFEAKGDTPALCLASLDGVDEAVASAVRNAFFLGYLVPAELLFDAEYYRWRLSGATLADCVARHAAIHAGEDSTVRIAALSTDSTPADGGLVRLPPLWTSTLAIEGQLEDARAELAAIELNHHDQEERSRIEIEALRQSAQHWQSEAEENWRAVEWFKGHITELQTSLAQSVEGQRLAERELGESRITVANLEMRVQSEEGQAARLRQRFDELQARLDAMMAERESAEKRLDEAIALATSSQARAVQADETLERHQHLRDSEHSAREGRIRELESELSQFVIFSSRIAAAAGYSTGAAGQAFGSDLRLLRDEIERHIKSIADGAAEQEMLVERVVATTAVLSSSQSQEPASSPVAPDDPAGVAAQHDYLALVSGRVACALATLERLRVSRDQAMNELTVACERLGRSLERAGLPVSDYPTLSGQIDRLDEWISVTQEMQAKLSAEVELSRGRRSLLDFIGCRGIGMGRKGRG